MFDFESSESAFKMAVNDARYTSGNQCAFLLIKMAGMVI